MKLPNWLLKQLPLWDYICPKCRRDVPKNSHKCPHCGEHYPFPLRVPPKVLKNPKALEDYVHRHIFPRISAKQREYLAQYFTVLFSDGFESGDFSAWDGTVGAPKIVTMPVHHGTYAALCNSNAIIYKNFSPQNVVYFRFYVMFSGLPSSSGEWIHFATVLAGTVPSLQMRVQHDGTSPKFCLRNYNEGTLNYGRTVQPNTWYCVEIKGCNIGYGPDLVYINGVQEINDGSTYGAHGQPSQVDIKEYTEWTYVNIYFDCVVVADTYIGPEPLAYQQLIISTTVGGTTNPAPGTYTVGQGSTVQVTAIADSGYRLDHWELDGTNIGATNPITVLMNTDHTLLAVFTAVPIHTLTVDSTPIQGVPFTIEKVG